MTWPVPPCAPTSPAPVPTFPDRLPPAPARPAVTWVEPKQSAGIRRNHLAGPAGALLCCAPATLLPSRALGSEPGRRVKVRGPQKNTSENGHEPT